MREMTAVREELERMKQVTNELKKENGSYRSELETMKQQIKGLEKKLAEHKVGCFRNLIGRLSMLISLPICCACMFYRINPLESWRSQLQS